MIDCDVHVQIAHPEEILKFIDPAEREWYRSQAYLLGLPSYPWSNPSTWFRSDLPVDAESGMPGGDAPSIIRDALDGQGADIGILLNGWGACGNPCPADLDGNGSVNGADIGILLAAWG